MTCPNANVRNPCDTSNPTRPVGKVTPGFGVAAAAILTLTVGVDVDFSPPPTAPLVIGQESAQCEKPYDQMLKEPAPPADS